MITKVAIINNCHNLSLSFTLFHKMKKIILTFLISISTLTANVFETLDYGDTKEEVQKKLQTNPRIKANVPETMLARVGLNGSFEVNKDLGGLKFVLYFGWGEDGKLNEITLRSKPIEASEYDTTVAEAFKSAESLVSSLHGKPAMSNALPPKSDIPEGSILNSHLWHPTQGSILLGVAQLESKFHISVRYTQESIKPVATP